MIGMQYSLQSKGVLEVTAFGSVSSSEPKWKKEITCPSNEPISVLDTRSPSPSTSTSTLCGGSTDNTATLAAVSGNNNHQKWLASKPPESGSAAVTESTAGGSRKDEWAEELQPIPAGMEVAGGERFGFGLEDWEGLLCESGQDQSLLRWISGEVDDASFGLKSLLSESGQDRGSTVGPAFAGGGSTGNAMASVTPLLSCGDNNGKIGSSASSTIPNTTSGMGNSKATNVGFNFNNTLNPFSLSNQLPSVIYQLENPDEKPQIFNPHVLMNQQLSQETETHSPNLFPFPTSLYAQTDTLPQPKRQNLGLFDPPPLVLAQQMQILQKPLMVPKQEVEVGHGGEQNRVLYDQLYKAAELILAGNFSHAQGILARLNHQLSPLAKPFQRAAFYFKEALQLPLLMPNLVRTPSPFDAMFKMGAYKQFSEVSPLLQFANFTANQALLEALGDAECVHVIDFDIGFGAQWASFMQELPMRSVRGNPSLKITAFASPLTHHPIELGLMHENLTQFANEIGINFELEIINFDAFDPSCYSMPPIQSPEKEAIVVNFPLWACSSRLFMLPSLLRFIKKLSPKIMVSMECGFERADLPFSHHLLHALQYYEVLLDSIDAANVNSETMNKIERFLFQPRIESIVLGRLHAPDPMPHWKALFASAGFSPVAFSNFTETQAECVLKRSQVRGFHVEKRHGLLVLYWQRQELMLASAWRC